MAPLDSEATAAASKAEQEGGSLETVLAVVAKILAPAGALGLLCDLAGYEHQQAAAITLIAALLIFVILKRESVDQWFPGHRAAALMLALLLLGALFADSIVKNAFRWSPLGRATGLWEYYETANKFVETRLGSMLDEAKDEVFIHGVSFYITLPDRKGELLGALARGVTVKFLVYDPAAPNMSETAEGFSQTPEELRSECRTTVNLLRQLREEARARKLSGDLQVRLFRTTPRMRLYVIDRRNPTGLTFFVPHVDQQNSPNLPGYLVKNGGGVAKAFFEGLDRLWAKAIDFDAWLAVNGKLLN
jgi:hypothetical protein